MEDELMLTPYLKEYMRVLQEAKKEERELCLKVFNLDKGEYTDAQIISQMIGIELYKTKESIGQLKTCLEINKEDAQGDIW